MNSQLNKTNTTLATLIHISTFSKFLIPLGNFLFPVIFWVIGKKDKFVDENGRQALNFQISIFLYYLLIIGTGIAAIVIAVISLDYQINIDNENFYISEGLSITPIAVILGIAGILIFGLFILEIICVITATMKASDQLPYKYPLAIPFLNSSNQSKNEPINNNTQNDTL